MFLLCPSLDYSTNPPTDPEVVTVRNHQKAGECTVECGATESEDGYDFEKGFLSNEQCGECFWTTTCEAPFYRAYNGWLQDYCCKRHKCSAKTYKASEMSGLFRELGMEDQANMYDFRMTVDTTSDPGVPVHCVYSHNVQTHNALNVAVTHNGERQDLAQDVITLDDGDQTCDHKSLTVCSRWASTKKSYLIPGVAHSSMMNVQQVIDVVVAAVTDDDAALEAWESPAFPDVVPKALHVDDSVLLVREAFGNHG